MGRLSVLIETSVRPALYIGRLIELTSTKLFQTLKNIYERPEISKIDLA